MAYYKAKLKINGIKASPCFLMGNVWDKFFLHGLCYTFHSDTFLLALPVSLGYRTQSEYYIRPTF